MNVKEKYLGRCGGMSKFAIASGILGIYTVCTNHYRNKI